jgi:hypothetical protein
VVGRGRCESRLPKSNKTQKRNAVNITFLHECLLSTGSEGFVLLSPLAGGVSLRLTMSLMLWSK